MFRLFCFLLVSFSTASVFAGGPRPWSEQDLVQQLRKPVSGGKLSCVSNYGFFVIRLNEKNELVLDTHEERGRLRDEKTLSDLPCVFDGQKETLDCRIDKIRTFSLNMSRVYFAGASENPGAERTHYRLLAVAVAGPGFFKATVDPEVTCKVFDDATHDPLSLPLDR